MIIMTKKQEQTKLDEIIIASGIKKSIEQLKKMLYTYRQSELIKKNVYTVRIEFIDVQKKLNSLENQLEEIIYLSKTWELE